MRFAALVSGSGTNLQSLLDAEARGALAPAEIALVVCNRPRARAIERARAASKPVAVIDHRDHDSREAFERAMLAELAARDVQAVVLAGFMRVLTEIFVEKFPNRIINIHPALLPAFPGVKAPAQAIDYGVKLAGCTAHFVDAGVDTGPIIAQACVEVRDDDDAASLHERIKVKEHELLPRVTRLLASGALVCEGRRVISVSPSREASRAD